MIDEQDALVRRLRADASRLDAMTQPITAVEVDERAAVGVKRSRLPSSRSGPRAVLAVAVVSALVIGALGIALTAHRSGPSHRSPAVSSSSTVPRSASESVHPNAWSGQELYLEPRLLPAGFHLVYEAGGYPLGSSTSEGDRGTKEREIWVRFNPAHDAVTAALNIAWAQPRTKPLAPFEDSQDDPGAGPIAVRSGVGWYSPRSHLVAWEEPLRQADLVSCLQCSRSDLVRIANALVRNPHGGFQLPSRFEGFEFISEAPGFRRTASHIRQLDYEGPRNTAVAVVVANDTLNPPFNLLGVPDVRLVNLRGTQGIVGPTDFLDGAVDAALFKPAPTLSLQWLEYTNIEVTLAGSNLTRAQLVAIANGLRHISRQRWTELGGSTTVTVPPTSP